MQSDISPAEFDAIRHDSAIPSSPGVTGGDKEREKSLQSYQRADKSEVAIAACSSVCDTSVVSCGEAELIIISESDEEQLNSEVPDATNSEAASDVISKSKNNIERLQNDLLTKLNPETTQRDTVNSPKSLSDFHSNERVTDYCLSERAYLNNRLKIAFWNSEPDITNKDSFNNVIASEPVISVKDFRGGKSVTGSSCSSNPASFEVPSDKNIQYSTPNYKSESDQHIKTDKVERKLSDEQRRTANIVEKNLINKSNFEKNTRPVDYFISISSPDLKRFDDNNNKVLSIGNRTIERTGKKDGYAEFVRKLSVDRYVDDDIDYSLDLGRAAASQLLSSDSEESVDDDLISNFRKEVFSLSNPNVVTLPSVSSRESVTVTKETQQESRNSRVQQSPLSGDIKFSTSPFTHDIKTAPIIETPAEKKRLGGIRRLLSPNLFSNDSRRKTNIDQGCGKHPDHADTKSKTLLETAFVGDVSKKQRSKSVSPNRSVNDDRSQVKYGIPKRKSDEVRQCCHDNSVKCSSVVGNRPELGFLQVDTENKRDSVASSTSSTSTLVSPEEKNSQWIKDTIKTQSLPQHYQSVKSRIPLNQSGRLSAPPYINYYNSPYGHIKHDTLLMPVSAQMKITSPPQYHNIKAKQLQNYDFLYRNQSSSVESSPGSQNSPQSYEIRNFDHAIGPNVSLVKPQPVYNRGVHSRPRSVSPATGRMGSFVTPENYFVRGSNQRHTISGGARQRQSTIYEEVQDDKEIKLNEMKYKKNSSVDLNTSVGSKRVSFSPNYEHDINSENVYWPTRKGLAPEPPTRQSAKPENDSYIHQTDADYVNISEMKMKSVTEEAPNRPLPPVPKRTVLKQNSVGYGVIGRNVSRSLNQALSDSAVLRQVNQPTTPRVQALSNRWQQQSDTESGSEAGEIQRILQDDDGYRFQAEEEWAGGEGKSGRSTGNAEQSAGTTPTRDEDNRRGRGRRDDPRRHTLSGDHHHNYPSALARSMDLESPLPRGYPPPSTAMLFDEDPGIMSEVETSSTGFRRGGKQRSSLPVVRTPSKTLERPLGSRRGDDSSLTSENHNSTLQADDTIVYNNIPLHCGLVFLQYRSETKRALLPNEITSIDTVKALFVRSFPKQLTMEYLDSPMVKIYIHDSSKDMFYELEDLRSHLRDIRDRSVLRLFESADVSGSGMPGGLVPPPTWDQDQSYFSEPEFDSEYQHQHIHKTKGSKSGHQPYYMTHSFPPGGAPATLPRSGPLLRAFSPALPGASKPPSDRIHADAGYMSSPERGGGAPPRSYPPSYAASTTPYEDPYYSQYSSRTGSITPVIDEEASDTELIDESYSLYGVKLPVPRGQFPAPAIPSYDSTRIRVEHMERQLANLTGLVQKALTQAPTPTPREFLQVPPGSTSNYPSDDYDKHSSSSSASLPDESYHRPDSKPPKLGRDKSVSFEKSVSFSDEPPDMNSPKQHSPQHGVDTKPTKPAIKSSTLPRTSSQERDRHKPAPPPKPVSLSPGQYEGRHVYRDLQLTPEMYNQLRGLQKKAKDLRQEVRNLRRMSQAQAHTVRETIRDTFIKIRAMIMTGGEGIWSAGNDTERTRLNREEDLYKQEMIRLESDLTELESTVEELRGNVINRKTRVNMSDVENMALVLSKSSKTVADLKLRFPSLQEAIRSLLNQEMEKVVCEEKFLKEEPERLESALRRCKKLTGTLVTLKRLASVQEQRLPEARISPTLDETPPVTPTSGKATGTGDVMGQSGSGGSTTSGRSDTSRPENALDALLDELQTFAKPPVLTGSSTLRRLHSYPSGEGGKPPVPERGADLLNKRVPPPPPPRTSSRSPLSSPTGPSVPPRGSPLKRNTPGRSSLKENTKDNPTLASNSSSCESVNSQEGMQHQHQQSRQELLEQRHQELLRKQRALQEQYTRLQQLQRAPPPDLLQLKKTGSESNLLAKMGLGLSAAVPISGSLSHLGPSVTQNPINTTTSCNSSATITTANTTTTTAAAFTSTTTTAVGTTTTASTSSTTTTTNIATVTNNTSTATIIPPATTNKIYETDIL